MAQKNTDRIRRNLEGFHEPLKCMQISFAGLEENNGLIVSEMLDGMCFLE